MRFGRVALGEMLNLLHTGRRAGPCQKSVDTRAFEVQVLRSRREFLLTGKEVRAF